MELLNSSVQVLICNHLNRCLERGGRGRGWFPSCLHAIFSILMVRYNRSPAPSHNHSKGSDWKGEHQKKERGGKGRLIIGIM